jgi:NADP-dependent 3-hydroxy acid dehydrogenase YdfG
MHQDWTTQNIVVTGAASGLGRVICVRFVQLGGRVIGLDLNEPALREMQSTFGQSFSPATCDICDHEHVAAVFERLGAVDVLVNSAGITGRTNVKSQDTDPVDVERVF